MKTFLVVVVAVVGTMVLFPRSSGQAATYGFPVGRYAIAHLDQQRALMLDTVTGAVWEYVFNNYCQSPHGIRPVGPTEECKDGESPLFDVRSFARVSVEGLYTTGLQTFIDNSIGASALQKAQKPRH